MTIGRRPLLAFRLLATGFLLTLSLLAALAATGGVAAATTVAVTTTDDTTNACATTGVAPCSLRDAIAYANANATAANVVTVAVPAGIYTLTDNIGPDPMAPVALNYTITAVGVVINGVGADTGNGPATIIDGGSVNGGGAGNFVRVFDVTAGASATFSNLTIRNGGNGSTGTGGGISNLGTLALSGVTVIQNGAPGGSGPVASGLGGGIYNEGTLTVTGSTIRANAAPFGGGIYNADPGTVALNGVTVQGNVAYFGGGIGNTSNSPTALTIGQSLITGNTASTEIIFALFTSGNTAGGLGAGIFTGSGTTTIDRSTISGNLAAGVAINATFGRRASLGGAIYSAASPGAAIIGPPGPGSGSAGDTGIGNGVVSVTTSTLSGNTATAGGAVYQHSNGAATLTGVTINDNSTGLAVVGTDPAPATPQQITVARTIVAGSRAGANCTSDPAGGVIDGGFNLDSGATCAFAAATSLGNANPQLDPLASNGGPTPTHALRAGSPAIDAAGAGCATPDQREIARPQGSACDIGAYEFVPAAPQVGLNPAALDFGGQEVGTTGAAKQIAVSNTGTAPLAIASATISGANAADFALVGNTCGATLAPGTACVLTVTFTPSAQGARAATLTITDNNGNVAGSTQTVALTGTGTIAVSYSVVLSSTGPGVVSPAPGTYNYQAGKVVNYAATPTGDAVFIGWTVDNQFVGFGNPLTLPVTKNRTVVATFAPRPGFSDVATGNANYEAITQLAARGIIRGNGDGTYAPAANVLRAQSAGLIARTFGWDKENHGQPFPDRCDANGQNCIDDELWNDVGSLAFYNVARGYSDRTYQPRNPVLNVQAISFITRAFVARNYWISATVEDTSIYPNVPQESGHRLDLITYVANAGAVPGQPANGPFAGYDQPATRGFYAQSLWQAYSAYFGTNRIP